MATTELRPCPFCGSGLVGPLAESSCPGDRLGVVGCGVCGASGPSLFDAGELVARWNARAELAAEREWCAKVAEDPDTPCEEVYEVCDVPGAVRERIARRIREGRPA